MKTKPKVKAKRAKKVRLRPANATVKLARKIRRRLLKGAPMYLQRGKFVRSSSFLAAWKPELDALSEIIRINTEQNASTGRREKVRPHTAGGARVRK